MTEKNNMNLKRIIYWFITTIIIFSYWYSSYDPINDRELLLYSKIVNGKITQIDKSYEWEESFDGRKNDKVDFYTYSYSFITSNGVKYNSNCKVMKRLPKELMDFNDSIPVFVNYIESNPNYSRVYQYTSENKTIYEWYRYTIFPFILIVLLWVVLSYFYLIKKRN